MSLEDIIKNEIVTFRKSNRYAKWLILDTNTFYKFRQDFNENFWPKEYVSSSCEPIDRILGLKVALVDTPNTIIEVR